MPGHKDVNRELNIETFLAKFFFDRKEHTATIWELTRASSQLVSRSFWISVSLSSMILLHVPKPKESSQNQTAHAKNPPMGTRNQRQRLTSYPRGASRDLRSPVTEA
jgi:hypothetical protein